MKKDKTGIDDCIKLLEKERKETYKEFSGFCEDRVIDSDMFDNFNPEGDGENLAWESGYYRGLEVAINTLKSKKEK